MIPPTLGKALNTLDRLGHSEEWWEFALVRTSRGHGFFNAYGHLVKRGWIEDDGTFQPYKPGEPFTGPRVQKWRLSESGREALAQWRREQEEPLR